MPTEPLTIERNALPAGQTDLELGDLSIVLGDGHVKRLSWHGVELLRGVTYHIRDADWGTIPHDTAVDSLTQGPGGATYSRVFSAAGEGIAGRFTLEANASGRVSMGLALMAKRRQTVCRAGFALLHPIVGLAGQRLRIVHNGDSVEETVFPAMISPSQPAFDIAGLRYELAGCAIDIAMAGDVFEMEDQRNWSDASFKTYCRPLARPYPYVVEQGETINQTLAITIEGQPRTARPSRTARQSASLNLPGAPLNEVVPSVALAVESAWQRRLDGGLAAVRRIVRADLRDDPVALPEIIAPFDLELITGDDATEARKQLLAAADRLSASGLVPEHVLALPGAYLKSYQPDAKWPAGATPSNVVAAARAAFPKSKIGGGVLTNFTEFNRCRPEPADVDYVSHGSSAIVHAADDRAIFQTIEALPQIFASARAIAPRLPYRLGLVSIGMRTNPYGEGLADNPDGVPRTMTDADPRARSIVGAAWMVAATAATRGFGIEVIALGAPSGPFGIVDGDTGRLRPSYHVVRGLNAIAGLPRAAVELGNPTLHVVAAFRAGALRLILANGSPKEERLTLPPGTRGSFLDQTSEAASATDPAWIETSAEPLPEALRLAPYAVAFLSAESRA